MRRFALATLLLAAGCTDSTDISLYIPFALFATDELSASSSGLCGFTPIAQAQGFYKSTGLLEMDPNINSDPSYVLGLQVENYLDETIIADSNGDPLVGPQRNNFNFKYALVKYIDVGGNLGSTPDVQVPISGVVRPGGEQNAGSIAVEAVSNRVAKLWLPTFQAGLSSEQVILSVQIFGELSTGERTQTGVFDFPLTVCFDCTNISPTAAPGTSNGCANGTAAVPSGHGPCCAPQDFVEVCADCGKSGQPCCPDFGQKSFSACVSTGSQTLTCSAQASSSNGELCAYPQQALIVCGTSS